MGDVAVRHDDLSSPFTRQDVALRRYRLKAREGATPSPHLSSSSVDPSLGPSSRGPSRTATPFRQTPSPVPPTPGFATSSSSSAVSSPVPPPRKTLRTRVPCVRTPSPTQASEGHIWESPAQPAQVPEEVRQRGPGPKPLSQLVQRLRGKCHASEAEAVSEVVSVLYYSAADAAVLPPSLLSPLLRILLSLSGSGLRGAACVTCVLLELLQVSPETVSPVLRGLLSSREVGVRDLGVAQMLSAREDLSVRLHMPVVNALAEILVRYHVVSHHQLAEAVAAV